MNLKRISDTLKSYDFRSYNLRIVIYCVALSIIGINVISSATSDTSLVTKQIFGLIGGVIVMIILSLIRYDFIARYYWLIYIVSLILLIAVLTSFLGDLGGGGDSGGAQRWIDIGFVRFQPSEIAKLLLIVFFATYMSHNQYSVNSFKFLLFTAALLGLPVFLILKEPDLSTSIVTILSICVIIFASAIKTKVLKRIALFVVPVMAIMITLVFVLPPDKNILEEYQYNRIVGFYDEDNEEAERIRYQQENSVLAIAGGSLTGKGLHNNSTTSVKNADFISAPETDCIFTIAGEELGFVGSVAIIVLLGLIVFECFRTARKARDAIGMGIALGFGSLIGFQSFINLGVVTMLIPNTGLTLPFMSAGLTSLIILFAGVGMIINIGLRKKISF